MKTNLITFLFVIVAMQGIAQDSWEPIPKPTGGQVFSIIAGDSVMLFIGTGNGVYRTENNGQTYDQLGPTNKTVYSLVCCHNVIYAGTNIGLYKSDNYGIDWIEILNTPSNVITIYMKNPNEIFAGGWGWIYKSTDGGVSWTQVLALDNLKLVTSIIEDSDGVLYAGITPFTVSGLSFYRSFNSGDTWESTGLQTSVYSLANTAEGNIIMGGGNAIYKSENMGESWTKLIENVNVKSIVVTPAGVIYAGSNFELGHYGGVLQSIDNGTSWDTVNTGLTDFYLEDMVLSPNGYLFLNGRFQLYKSTLPVPDSIYSVTINTLPSCGGNVTGGGNYLFGDTAFLTAAANADYVFENWTIGSEVLSTDSSLSIEVTSLLYITANFRKLVEVAQPPLNKHLCVYPNPFSTTITIEGSDASFVGWLIEIYSQSGQLVYTCKELDNECKNINLGFLNNGIYFISIKSKHNYLTTKIVKLTD